MSQKPHAELAEDCVGGVPVEAAPAAAAPIEWSPGQKRAIALARVGQNLAILGAGGVGKSTLISEIVRNSLVDGLNVTVSSSTGCSSVLLCKDVEDIVPTTVHRAAGVGLARGSVASLIAWVRKFYPARRWWRSVDVWVIDEISMISDDLFLKLDAIGRDLRSDNDPRAASKPFGGIQLIVSGDFHQLPPVEGGFAFEAAAWDAAIPLNRCVILRRNFRQDGDDGYARITAEARFGRVSDESYAALETRVVGTPPADEVDPPTTLVPTKAEAYDINRRRMARLEGEFVTRRATWEKAPTASAKKSRSYHDYMLDKFPGEEVLRLKVGTKVVHLVNEPKLSLHNGLAGIVVAFTPSSNLPVVEFENGVRHTVQPHAWDAPEHAGALVQVPLIVGWALTIHKAQGMQLSRVRINAGPAVFASGQGYVAISRAKRLADVEFTALSRDSFRASAKSTRFYVRVLRANRPPKPTADGSVGGGAERDLDNIPD